MEESSSGFTIIELIVVIAIIAVLAAIVLVNVTSYIGKGKDAAVEANMDTLLLNSAVYYNDPNNNSDFSGFCTDPTYTSVAAAVGNDNSVLYANCGTSPSSTFVACANLVYASGNYWCVDSTGIKKSESGSCNATPSYTACP